MLMEVEHLRVSFPSAAGLLRVVDGVSFGIDAGEVLGLAGESGCGKTTTALSLLRLIKPPGVVEGSILFDGKNIMELDNEGLREYRWKEVSMVFQGAMSSLNPVKKVGYQLVDTILDHTSLKRQEAVRLAKAALKKVKLPEEALERFPHQLSGGQKQRVVIAMAIALNPRLIIADEPTTALDILTQEKILALLRDIVRSTGSAVLFISHDLSVLAKICDRIAVMYMGRIVEIGKKEDVLFSPAHPYTKGLIDSNITVDKRGNLVQPIGGSPTLVVGDVRGCRFNPRCAYATPECVSSDPPRLEYTDGRSVYCYHPRYIENG